MASVEVLKLLLVNGFPSKNCRHAVAKRVVAYLNTNGPGSYGVDDPVVRSIRCEPVPEHLQIDGPLSFHVPTGGGARVNIVKPIKDKIGKPYDSRYLIQLLAWSTTATATEFEFTGQQGQLVQWLHLNGLGSFERIWIFGYGDKSIVFDSGGTD